jgi:hypothetical protein
VITTLVAPSTDRAKLLEFYAAVRPAGPGWKAIRDESGLPASSDSMSQALAGWTLGCVFVYAALFGTGSFIYGRMPQFYIWLAVAVLSGIGLSRVMRTFFRVHEAT